MFTVMLCVNFHAYRSCYGLMHYMYFIHLILLCVTFSSTLALQQVMLQVHECLMHIFTVTHSPVFTAAVLFTLCFLCLWE